MSWLLIAVFFLCLYLFRGDGYYDQGYSPIEILLLVLLIVAAVYVA